MHYVSLPLYEDSDFQYDVSLENNYYTLRIYYNERTEGWFFELRDGENDMLVAGERLVANYPINFYYNLEGLSGCLWLESIGPEKNQTSQNPFDLSTYYRLYYLYPTQEEIEIVLNGGSIV